MLQVRTVTTSNIAAKLNAALHNLYLLRNRRRLVD